MHPEVSATVEANATDEEGYNEGDEGDDYDYDGGDDIEAEAEDMARRLQDQLRADIAKAQREVAAAAQQTQAPQFPRRPATPAASVSVAPSPSTPAQRQAAAIVTMKNIISFASRDPFVHATFSESIVHSAGNANILDMFHNCISSGIVSKNAAKSLREVVLSLAKSDVLFPPRNSSATQADVTKRKRNHFDNGINGPIGPRPYKRVAIDQPDLSYQIAEAVRIVSHALTSTSSNLDSAVIAPIQPQLYQTFLFAVTSSPCVDPYKAGALQELAGLIQMLGVLSGVHIGSGPSPSQPTPWAPHPSADIGTAVYPCLVPACNKTFHRLYSLRAHQRTHTLVDRPYRCTQCPASFVRNHDLKRHARLHDKKAWRCSGCGKVFSRRDAIKRHQDNRGRSGGKARGEADGGESVCAYAQVEEVEIDKPDVEDDASRRAKLWNGIAAGPIACVSGAPHGSSDVAPSGFGHSGFGSGHEMWSLEEGEVPPGVIEQAQAAVLQLLGSLQAYVARATGTSAPAGHSQAPTGASSTLASLIANVQSSALAVLAPASSPAGGEVGAEPSSSARPNPTPSVDPSSTSLSLSWLSEDQTRMLEQAIAQAASAAQAQAEAEAALEEEGEEDDHDDGESHGNDLVLYDS